MLESHAVAFNVTVFCVGSENEIISRLVFCRDIKSELNLISETQAAWNLNKLADFEDLQANLTTSTVVEVASRFVTLRP